MFGSGAGISTIRKIMAATEFFVVAAGTIRPEVVSLRIVVIVTQHSKSTILDSALPGLFCKPEFYIPSLLLYLIKLSNNLFGFISVGKWIDIKPEMKIGLKKSHKGYRAYIRGAQPIGIHNRDIRIFLYGSDNKQIMPIKKFDSYESSKSELKSLSTLLGIEII